MIGTHNSFSYMQPKNKLFNLVKFIWRTQNKTIQEQKDSGASYFDIHIRRAKCNNKSVWRICSKFVDFNKEYETIGELFVDLNDGISFIRLILERSNLIDESVFKFAIKEYKDLYPLLSFAAINRTKEVLVDKDPSIKDFTQYWKFIKTKSWSKKYNPLITKKMVKDEDSLYFIDYL